ncbi:hypothetical protein DL766_009119 [Monosporascus sp. MC13-8B]|uniref:Uncharacterized protein n=1 Tax=Monosporascus cannonballus TaxID=155416 RepID=A0ABY0H5N1_9PEZI|nr:hypothetical protein DL762_005143 [Monosporascus cannonballus]RYO97211.1 hypothetical protein DL763_002872 [Monosporascus cannonballus]RYP16471.1 hypothetical protein DL766_009119 [Monosporascus sp. MC13-8B]
MLLSNSLTVSLTCFYLRGSVVRSPFSALAHLPTSKAQRSIKRSGRSLILSTQGVDLSLRLLAQRDGGPADIDELIANAILIFEFSQQHQPHASQRPPEPKASGLAIPATRYITY